MRVLFPQHMIDAGLVDDDYQAEWNAALAYGFDVGVVDTDALIVRDRYKAIEPLKLSRANDTVERAIYRGWMLTPDEYADLYYVLANRGVELITSSKQYTATHWLPRWYNGLREHTPESVWTTLPLPTWDDIFDQLGRFGNAPIIVKDYVKSEKHYWHEACFIPDASALDNVRKVVNRFLELRDVDIQGGLVFRRYVDLEQVGTHSISGMPLGREYRVFVYHGQPIYHAKYWENLEYTGGVEFTRQLIHAIETIKSDFFTVDFGRLESGEWIIIEIGDGGVSGLPEYANAPAFYQALAAHS